MPVYKDDGNGTFYVQCYYRDARGSKRHKTKRGFSSEVEAAVWESQFKSLNGGAMDMTFSEFVEVYASEVKPRIREHTWITKEYIINDKLVPFFGDMRMCDVRPIDVIRWQNELTEHRDADGKPWAPTYLRTVNNQLNAIFNHAERYYGLSDNPVRRVDKIGSKKGGEMQFWTKDEYLRFSEAVMDKPLSFHAFELLYWTGIRCGELLALTPSDFMLESSRLRINKSYQSLNGVDTVTDPKTPKSVRTIVMPAFLRDEMADFIEMRDDVAPDERLFAVTKHFLAHEMERGCKASGVKRIRIHDIRHSHVSLLIEMPWAAFFAFLCRSLPAAFLAARPASYMPEAPSSSSESSSWETASRAIASFAASTRERIAAAARRSPAGWDNLSPSPPSGASGLEGRPFAVAAGPPASSSGPAPSETFPRASRSVSATSPAVSTSRRCAPTTSSIPPPSLGPAIPIPPPLAPPGASRARRPLRAWCSTGRRAGLSGSRR